MIRWPNVALLTLLAALAAAEPAGAGSVEVTVRDNDGRALEHQNVRLRPLPVAGQAGGSTFMRRRATRWTPAGIAGKVRFDGIPPGTYAVELWTYLQGPFVRPTDNPFAPAPKVTLFDDQEHVTIDVELWRGVRVTVGLELPDGDPAGFRAVFRHPGSGQVRTAGFPRGQPQVERLLPPGVWEVAVEPRPGYLLVALDRDRVPLPGHAVRLDLLHEPSDTFLTWTYVTPAMIEGSVAEASGREPAVEIVATLVAPGPWHQAALERGGSIFERLAVAVDTITGTYEMQVPDGRWRVQPAAPALVSSEPEAVDLELAPGDAGRADFTVRLEPEGGGPPFVVRVKNERGERLRRAAVEVYDLSDPDKPVRSGVTSKYGNVSFDSLPAGGYRVIAGHADYLEGRVELPDYDPEVPEKRRIRPVVLPSGAEIRLQADDPAGEPLANVELTIERLLPPASLREDEDPPDTALRSPELRQAKRRRTAVTDHSGRASLQGFHGGTYRARAKLRGELGTRGLIHLAAGGGRLRPELEIEIAGTETIELVARMLPAASLKASLTCSDAWDLPDTVAVRVFDSHGFDPRASAASLSDLPEAGSSEAGPEVRFASGGEILGERSRDALEVGPFEQGVYHLAIRPEGFDRWTWAFETHDAAQAARIQIDVTGTGLAVAGELGKVDLGIFHIECGPAVDLLPAVASGAAFPDAREVAAHARFFDLATGREMAGRLEVTRQKDRILLRGAPAGQLRLDLTLSHPHLLPEPSLSWQLELELERGDFQQISPEVEALGGAVVISGAGVSASLHSPEGEVRRVSFRDGKAELPSLVPGRYRLEVQGPAAEPVQVWQDLQVRAGETLDLRH